MTNTHKDQIVSSHAEIRDFDQSGIKLVSKAGSMGRLMN